MEHPASSNTTLSDGTADHSGSEERPGSRSAIPPNIPNVIPLARGHVLLVGTGAFPVSQLPSWVVMLQRWYGWSIRVCLTHAASALVSPAALAAASRNPVTGPDWPTAAGKVPHQEVAQWADLVLVAPATTNFIGKCAQCVPDNLALSIVINTPAPVVLAPSVAGHVWRRPSLRRNLRLLEEDGYHIAPAEPTFSLHSGLPSQGVATDLPTVLRTAYTAVTVGSV